MAIQSEPQPFQSTVTTFKSKATKNKIVSLLSYIRSIKMLLSGVPYHRHPYREKLPLGLYLFYFSLGP